MLTKSIEESFLIDLLTINKATYHSLLTVMSELPIERYLK